MNKADLKLDWCSHEAAKYACEKWHYAGRISTQPNMARIGVWESGRFVGALLFNRGSNKSMAAPYGLTMFEACELARVALHSHATPVSRIVRVALRLIVTAYPRLRLVISYADPDQGHHGGIYQAGGWIYTGKTEPADEYVVNGRRMHGRALRASRRSHRLRNIPSRNILEWARSAVDPGARAVPGSSKHRYLYPLDSSLRDRLLPLALPYPKRAASVAGDTPGVHPGEGGSTPTAALSPSGTAEAT